MNRIAYLLIFSAVCIVWFVITRIWVGAIDSIISVFKKLFRIDRNDNTRNWHTLEDIRNKGKEE